MACAPFARFTIYCLQKSDNFAACLSTLGFRGMDTREQDISAAVEHTCNWLFDTPEFKKWRDRTDLTDNYGVLCIKGKPGAGKSTLMRHTLEYCQKKFSDHLIVAYFFNARGNTLEKTPLGMLRSIVYQLLDKDDLLYEQFVHIYRKKQITSEGRGWEWQQGELKTFIISVIQQWKSKPLLLFVDALDECNETDIQDVVEFLELLSTDAKKSDVALRICLSRRHHPPLRITKCMELIVENHCDHREDIATYIKAKLAKRDDEIEAEIERKADGIFMWVVLVIKLLNKASLKMQGKRKAMRKVLEEIPGELEEVFGILFKKDKDMAETVLMLQWVLFAQRPLKPEELCSAIEAEDEELWSQSGDVDHDSIQRSIEHLSKGLVEIRRGDSTTVQFIHLSVNDFLLRNKRLQKLDPALEPDPVSASHYRLWACCWLHIEQAGIIAANAKEVYEEQHRKYPLLGYAASHIFDHAEKVLAEDTAGQAGAEIGKWLRDANSWFKWWKGFLSTIHTRNERQSLKANMDAGLLYMVSLRGYRSLVKNILAEGGADVNAQGGEYGNALQAASRGGHRQIVERLLEAGADVNAQSGKYGNALQAASQGGHRQIVKRLLEADADVNTQGGWYGNALQAASLRGHQQIVERLLEAGADVNAQGGEYGNALQAASLRGHQQIVERLLEAGADVNAQGGEYGNALQAASQQIVERLLEAGADVNAQGGDFGNALQAASLRGHQQIVKRLLEAGADVNAQGGDFGNALQAALHKNHHAIANMLRKAGANVIPRPTVDSGDNDDSDAGADATTSEKSHDSVSPEAAPATVSPGTAATSPKIWFPFRTQGTQWSHVSPRPTLLWQRLFFVATCGLILWVVQIYLRGRNQHV
ncbi:hypothetical protein AYL99_09072 [Fonsecaea erecta]|uniref:Nephrocystin 3-like N-terminal domain-containing protein n=1 Tax=Fonsecaea erecta TaxID=1367422 RepID=A0A178ZB04_9EURO|nr:hypothetical protein AYL99_09072 [Fonsecaea erecta]OAP56960.1 hypothetical protein AYL99_09072 [Fonsecaea erecta]